MGSKMKNRLLKVSLVAALASTLSLTAGAATLVDVEGSVTVNRAGNLFAASNNTELKQGDIVSVYEGSARVSTCSEKIEMNNAVQVTDQACPAARELISQFSNGENVALASEETLAFLSSTAGKIFIAALAAGTVVAITKDDDKPASP